MTGNGPKIAVLGAGSWGTALAILLARNGQRAVLWGRDSAGLMEMRRQGRNARYLGDHPFPSELQLSADLEECLAGARFALVAVPSHAFRQVSTRVAESGARLEGFFWASKGFEPGSGRLLHQVAEDLLGAGIPTGVLSGPTFAGEIAAGLPAAVSCASSLTGFAETIAELFRNDRFRVYTSDDIIGVQVGGAVKNVLAIAAGIADGLGFGANTRAALITRGLSEITRLGVAMGGRQETFMGLAGLGDLVLTCTDDQSRNRRFGLALASGESVARAEQGVGQVVEGIGAAREVVGQAARLGVQIPIAEQVDRVVRGQVLPVDAVNTLLSRPPGRETD
jgi:glycerol-3-phosphate dehydrogenase (NAD(P)+)